MALSSKRAVLYVFLLGMALLLPGASAEDVAFEAGYRRETNAERFARGLPPMKPVKLYEPTRVGPELARRSIQPLTGVIAGYAPRATTPTCYFTYAYYCETNPNNAMHFSAAMQSNPQNIVATDPGLAGKILYLETDFADLGPTVENTGYIGAPDALHNTAPGATPAYDPNSAPYHYYETAIWYVAAGGGVSAIWINPTGSTNGASVPLIFYVAPNDNSLMATVDPASVARDGGVVLNLVLQ